MNGSSGWKVAGILGGLLAACLGVLLSLAAFSGDFSRIVSETNRHSEAIAEIRSNESLMRGEIARLTIAVDRLANELCYMRTNKPCDRGY